MTDRNSASVRALLTSYCIYAILHCERSQRHGHLCLFSVPHCRAFLGKTNLADREVAELRDQLYALAHVVLDQYPPKGNPSSSTTTKKLEADADFAAALKLIPTQEHDEVVERAALMEYDGRLDRGAAEKEAIMERIRKVKSALAGHLEGSGKAIKVKLE